MILEEVEEAKNLKYRFVIHYQTKNLRQVSELMSKLDLDMDKIVYQEVCTFRYKAEEKPINYFKDLLMQAYEGCECTVMKIEGGKIE